MFIRNFARKLCGGEGRPEPTQDDLEMGTNQPLKWPPVRHKTHYVTDLFKLREPQTEYGSTTEEQPPRSCIIS